MTTLEQALTDARAVRDRRAHFLANAKRDYYAAQNEVERLEQEQDGADVMHYYLTNPALCRRSFGTTVLLLLAQNSA